MHTVLILLASTTSTTVAGKSKSSSTLPLLILVALFVLVYALFIRPRQQRMRQQQTTARQLGVGDEVVSAGGIQGKVVAIDSDVAEVEVAPGVVLTFLRRSISPRPGTTASANRPDPEPVDDKWDLPASDEGSKRSGDDQPGTGGAGPEHPGGGSDSNP